jgi:hypothetical protein
MVIVSTAPSLHGAAALCSRYASLTQSCAVCLWCLLPEQLYELLPLEPERQALVLQQAVEGGMPVWVQAYRHAGTTVLAGGNISCAWSAVCNHCTN